MPKALSLPPAGHPSLKPETILLFPRLYHLWTACPLGAQKSVLLEMIGSKACPTGVCPPLRSVLHRPPSSVIRPSSGCAKQKTKNDQKLTILEKYFHISAFS